VVIDIQEKLKFQKKNVIQQSFERKNIAYVLLNEEDKLARLLKIINKIRGTGIIYVRNRKKTQEIANYLRANKISADFYHAGLDSKTRDSKQSEWITNKTRVIVCTNAFGMGIDKPDVRFVVHIDLPDTLEAYFQEAGRAGRDEQKAFAILLYNKGDKIELNRNVENSFPEMNEIRQTYQALANFYQIPSGSGLGTSYSFDISAFCDNYKLQAITVFNSLKFIEREGYILLSDAFFQAARIKLEINRDDLYKFQISNPTFDVFIKLLLRSYAGLFDNFEKINEFDLAKKLNLKQTEIVKRLNFLHQQKIITYAPQTELPQLTYTMPRVDAKDLSLSKENFSSLKKRAIERMHAVLNYTESTHQCRSQLLLAYFGEIETNACGQCDRCLEEKRKVLHADEFESISKQIKQLLSLQSMELKVLVNSITDVHEDKIMHTIQWMIDNEQLKYNDQNLLCIPLY
jgi:ATP-dependent DNA helicase RecQ